MQGPVRTKLSRLCLFLLVSPQLRGQQAPMSPPVPTQIAAGHTVFLTNSGADPNFPIDTTRAFNDVYAAIQARGRYRLVGSPEQADLVFQLRDVAPIATFTGAHGNLYSVTNPAFELTIIDPKTSIALWTITSPVNVAGRGAKFNHWVAISETNLVSRIQVLAGEPLSATETADLTTVPPNHFRRNVILLFSAVGGMAVAGYLIGHHLYEDSLANQKAAQDAFCKANNIPLSMCAGG